MLLVYLSFTNFATILSPIPCLLLTMLAVKSILKKNFLSSHQSCEPLRALKDCPSQPIRT